MSYKYYYQTFGCQMNVYDSQRMSEALSGSGFSETERVCKAQEIGAGAYVRKPYVLEKIGLAIRQELDKAPPSEGHGN